MSQQKKLEDFDYPDGFILHKFITDLHVVPQDPLAMIIGGGIPQEGRGVRNYYETRGFSNSQVKVASCNIIPFPINQNDLFDIELNGPMYDSSTYAPYFAAIAGLNLDPEKKFDLVYIRNPGIWQTENWMKVFSQALEHTSPGGVVATMIRESDAGHYATFLENFERHFNRKPAISREINLEMEGNAATDYHIIAAFKN